MFAVLLVSLIFLNGAFKGRHNSQMYRCSLS